MKPSLLSMRGVALNAALGVWVLAFAGCNGEVLGGGSGGTTTASGSGGASTGTVGPGSTSTGTSDTGSTSTSTSDSGSMSTGTPDSGSTSTGTPDSGGAPAACSEPASGVVPYPDPVDLYSLLIGQWIRCEGTIQPVGGAPAPDGQDGLEFSPPGPGQGTVLGLLPGSLPLPDGGTGVPPWVGGLYEPVTWTFTMTSTGPGVSFTGTTIGTLTDSPVFTNGGMRMSLSDPIWQGTYVRYQP